MFRLTVLGEGREGKGSNSPLHILTIKGQDKICKVEFDPYFNFDYDCFKYIDREQKSDSQLTESTILLLTAGGT